MGEFKRLATNERPQTRRQISGLRQNRPIHQYRHDPDVLLQRGLDLDADEILRVVDPPYPLGISDSRPMPPDKRQQNATPRHGLSNRLGEVGTDGNGVNVHKDAVFTEVVAKAIIQTASVGGCLLPPVTDEDTATTPVRTHCRLPLSIVLWLEERPGQLQLEQITDRR